MSRKIKFTILIIFVVNILIPLFIFRDIIFPLPEIEISEEKKNKINNLMTKFHENGQFQGTILVAANGDIVYQKAFGLADVEKKIPNTLSTKFRIASATKQITATLVLQLVDEGKLRLDGTVSDYLPDYPLTKNDKITIWHLLTHTSGIIGESSVQNLETIEKLYHTKEEILEVISKYPLSFDPGDRWQYSNFGYFLLGVIIEKVSGQSYQQLLKEKICDRVGMTNTIPDENSTDDKDLAIGYHYDHIKGIQEASFLDMSFVFAYGHLLSTVNDLFLFDQALYSEKLLKNKLKDYLFDDYVWSSQRIKIGNSSRKVKAKLINGSINGFKCNIIRIPKDRVYIIQQTNHKEPQTNIIIAWNTSDIATRILAILYEQEYELPKKSAAYAVFREMLDTGVPQAVEKYETLKNQCWDSYYFKDDEFITLSRKLHDANKRNEAKEYFNLISNN